MSEWQPIETAPKDGTHFLAWARQVADEMDENDNVLRKNVVEHYQVIMYWALFGFITFPWTGGIPVNVTYSHWMPLPSPPPQPEAER